MERGKNFGVITGNDVQRSTAGYETVVEGVQLRSEHEKSKCKTWVSIPGGLEVVSRVFASHVYARRLMSPPHITNQHLFLLTR